MHLVVATANQAKFQELVAILSDLRISFLSTASLDGYVPPIETGATYAENAAAKATAAARFAGLWALADDSGLEIDALGGQPGPFSSRFLGVAATDRDRNQRILDLLQGVPAERRSARFQCAVAIAGPRGELFLTHGSCEGSISEAMGGAEGFGYDPIFLVPDVGVTMASLSPDLKNRISHRARALEEARPLLRRLADAVREGAGGVVG
ncbi:MAG: RdgB/HAM1 family non-canonical purine NTP pyrophosphatase [Candidatus Methylomirabilaceae bacterium]